jgi:hypothetical protein
MFAPVMTGYACSHPTANRSSYETHRYGCDHEFHRRRRMRIPLGEAKQ